jgi:hypothetical protein
MEASDKPREGTMAATVMKWVVAFLVGLSLAWGASVALRYAIRDEVVENAIRNYEQGKPPFEQSMGSRLADIRIEHFRHEIERRNVMRRFDAAHSLPINFAVRLASFLMDPINVALTIVFALVAATIYSRLARLRH